MELLVEGELPPLQVIIPELLIQTSQFLDQYCISRSFKQFGQRIALDPTLRRHIVNKYSIRIFRAQARRSRENPRNIRVRFRVRFRGIPRTPVLDQGIPSPAVMPTKRLGSKVPRGKADKALRLVPALPCSLASLRANKTGLLQSSISSQTVLALT